MLAWLKQKPRLTPRSQYPPEIMRAIHSMTDDVSGNASTRTTDQEEPLVSFQPGQESGAPFYAAPEIQKPVTLETPLAPSPFLDMTQSAAEPAALPSLETQGDKPQEENMEVGIGQEEKVATRREVELDGLSRQGLGAEGIMNWWHHFKKWIIFGGGVVGLLLVMALAWWYWQKMHTTVAPPMVGTGEVQEKPPEIMIEASSSESSSREHYSTSQPNLLSFDTESVTAEAMSTEFLKIARSLEQDGLRDPVEFLIRDQNYNPLAFARFAYLFDLDIPAELLSTLDEGFSLYFYLDQDRPRMGLRVNIKDKETFLVSSKANEAVLPQVLEPLFLDKTTAPRSGLVFRSSLYQEQPIRYANVDREMNLSIDYAIREQYWCIGTSQNTLRAILDRTSIAPK
ncbi:MAG: hypothetical protein E6P95_00115 [Candidatus Moraniibacteriota bacterium]|nr:MAG: hypothetical protein E6P95_00115 [Candidatus Moranbacteria bacterium]